MEVSEEYGFVIEEIGFDEDHVHLVIQVQLQGHVTARVPDAVNRQDLAGRAPPFLHFQATLTATSPTQACEQ